MGRFGIGARVRDNDGDEGVIVDKRKGERLVKHDAGWLGEFWRPKAALTALESAASGEGVSACPPVFAKEYSAAAGGEDIPWVPKVGDRVRLKEGYGGPRVGSEGLVDELFSSTVSRVLFDPPFQGWGETERHWHCHNNDLEPVVAPETTDDRAEAGGGFKAGDRIRLIDSALREMPLGTEVLAVAHKGGVVSKSSVCYDNNGHITWRPGSYFELVKPVAEQPAGLVVQAGRFYVTRDGRKVGPIAKNDWDADHPFECLVGFTSPEEVTFAIWTPDGTNYEYRWLDLISEWVEPALTAEVEPQPKFKAGDKVRAIKSSWGTAYQKGEIYEVREAYVGHISTVLDSVGSRTNGWSDENFELIVEPEVAVAEATATAAEPEPKFKVGDRIRRTGHGTDYAPSGFETFVSTPGYFWDVEGQEVYLAPSLWELAEPAAPPAKFKVGDRVVIARNSRRHDWLNKFLGTELSISAVDGTEGTPGWALGGNSYWWPEIDLDHVSTQPQPFPSAQPSPSPPRAACPPSTITATSR